MVLILDDREITDQELNKYTKPYTENTGEPVNFETAAKSSMEFLEKNHDLLKDVGKMLNETSHN